MCFGNRAERFGTVEIMRPSRHQWILGAGRSSLCAEQSARTTLYREVSVVYMSMVSRVVIRKATLGDSTCELSPYVGRLPSVPI